MKLAGELGDDALPELKAVCAVSPVIELEACVRAIERRENRVYEWNFCRNLQAACAGRRARFPMHFDLAGLWKVWSIRAVRRALHRAASRLRRRQRLLSPRQRHARDRSHRASGADPERRRRSVRARRAIFAEPAVADNPHITTLVTQHGGHCAFVEEPNGYDGYWAEQRWWSSFRKNS